MNRPLILITTYIPCWTVEPNAKVTWGLGRGEGVDAGVGQCHVEEGLSTKLLGLLVEVAKEELVWVYCVLMALSAKLLSTPDTGKQRGAISRSSSARDFPMSSFFGDPIPTGGTGGRGGGPTLGLAEAAEAAPGGNKLQEFFAFADNRSAVREYMLTPRV